MQTIHTRPMVITDIMNYDDSELFDIGHPNPNQRGSNEVVLKKSPNRKLQDNPIPI